MAEKARRKSPLKMVHTWTAYFWVALGGALGSMARFWVSVFIGERVQGNFPWGTFLVNVLGSFIIGALAAALSMLLASISIAKPVRCEGTDPSPRGQA